MDGVNPFGKKSFSWSTWPILLFDYNLPPLLVTKNIFVMLALVLLGKKFVKMRNINVYMALVIEKLQMLWKGVVAYDVVGLKHYAKTWQI
jgi:hypothetical protein